jgi:para-nitrobenzyl esterase
MFWALALSDRELRQPKNLRRISVSIKIEEAKMDAANAGLRREDRRTWIKSAATMIGGVGAAAMVPAVEAGEKKNEVATAAAQKVAAAPAEIVASDENAIIETSAGKIRGYTRNGIQTFKGIPYAGSTAGKTRFLPPVKPTPWSGLRGSMQYGYDCPQQARGGWANDEEAWLFSWDDGIPGEDCLHLNVWTPGHDNQKRPVMVWLHGGGFQAGSGQELKSYDGERLSRRGDVVVVSLNHRIGILGHLNLAAYGEAYASSANVGMLDIVAALEWVRDNIGNFGGDAGNVTIFGQSGGGGKVNTLMAMPSAKGLFHRAIVQSGSLLRGATEERSASIAAEVLAVLGLSGAQVGQLQGLPYQKLIEAGGAVQKKHVRTGLPDVRKMGEQLIWAPVVDGDILPRHPFDPDAPPLSAQVPMLIGTVLNEFLSGINHPEYEMMTDDEVKDRVSKLYGEKSGQIISAFHSGHPKDKPFDILSRIQAAPVRQGAVTQCALKAAQGAAPAYLYWFTWKTPVLDARPRAFHCAELAFCFDNTERCENMTGDGPEARRLAAQVSEAWIHFARTGNPSHSGLPAWPAFTADKCQTMIFDSPCEMKSNSDTAERNAMGL